MLTSLYRFFYFCIIAFIDIEIKDDLSNPVFAYAKRHKWLLRLAFIFNSITKKPILLLIGDSNAYAFNYRGVKYSNRLFVGLGVPGARADHWIDFLNSKEGYLLKSIFLSNKHLVVWNIGGNHLLQSKMENMVSSLLTLFSFSFGSWSITLPPIHTGFLSTAFSEKYLKDGISEINAIIRVLWKDKVIDIHEIMKDPMTGEAFLTILSDPVHFSDRATKSIMKFINEIP